MGTPFSPNEQLVIVKYLHFMKTDPTEIHKLLSAACGEGAADYKIVKDWIADLSAGRVDTNGQQPTDEINEINITVRPQGPTCPAMVTRIEQLVSKDKRISLDRLSEMAVVSKYSVQRVVTNVLGLKRVCERWVPRLWTPEQRTFRVDVCKELMERYNEEGEDFLSRIIVGDEGFAYYYTPDVLLTDAQEEKRRTSKALANERYKPPVEPILVHFAIFYDRMGVLLMHQVPEGMTVTADYYADLIRDELVPEFQKRRKGRAVESMLLLHDNTPIHASSFTQKSLRELNIESLPHAPASPDLEPHEYFLTRHLKEQILGTPFEDTNTIISALQHHLYTTTEILYEQSITKLVGRWDHCIDSHGLYVL